MAYKKLLADEFIIKLVILFVFKNYKNPITNQLITELVLRDVEIDYFALQKCLYDLVNLGWIRVFKGKAGSLYELTEKGTESADYFEHRIPYLIRQKLLLSIRAQQNSERPKSLVESDIVVSEKGEFNVYLKIFEVGDLLFELNINVGSRDLAIKTKEFFSKNAMKIYMETTQNIMKDVK